MNEQKALAYLKESLAESLMFLNDPEIENSVRSTLEAMNAEECLKKLDRDLLPAIERFTSFVEGYIAHMNTSSSKQQNL